MFKINLRTMPDFLRQHFLTAPEVSTYLDNIQGEIVYIHLKKGKSSFSHLYPDFVSMEDHKTYYLGGNDIDFDVHIDQSEIKAITYNTDDIGQEDIDIFLKDGTNISIGLIHEEFRSSLEVRAS